MPVTMARINLIKGLGQVLQLAEVWTVDILAEEHKKLDDRTNKTWTTSWFSTRLTGK
jgi:L-fucose isomerase